MSDNWDIGTLSELHILFEWYVYIRNKLVVTDLFDRFVYWVFLSFMVNGQFKQHSQFYDVTTYTDN